MNWEDWLRNPQTRAQVNDLIRACQSGSMVEVSESIGRMAAVCGPRATGAVVGGALHAGLSTMIRG